MKEIICIHIGQAGVQIGEQFWNLICLEHGILQNGHYDGNQNTCHSFFLEAKENKYVPFCVFIDLEPMVIDEIRTGQFSELFNSRSLITGKESASNNWAKGMYTVGKEIIDQSLDRIRKIAESCKALQGFIIFHSIGGGTGAGFGSLLLDRLKVEYGKKQILTFTIYPSPIASAGVVESYNAGLATQRLLDHSDVTIMMDNESLYDICKRNLDIEKQTYINLNQLISLASSAVTSPIRFSGSLNQNLAEISMNLVPYQRTHFMLCSYSPLVSAFSSVKSYSTQEITNNVFEQSNCMLTCDTKNERYMACTLLYNGDVLQRDVNLTLENLRFKETIKFVDWIPTGFKTGIIHHQPTVLQGKDSFKIKRSGCLISNTYAVTEAFSKIDHKFDLIYAKRAFVHWYVGEGMEEFEMSEAREATASLEKDYESGYDEEVYGDGDAGEDY